MTKSSTKIAETDERTARLGKALRANLKRRKLQARERDTGTKTQPGEVCADTQDES